MDSIVLDLQQEVLKPNCDILNALRKAHLIAAKLSLTDFDQWIMYELNGYAENWDDIPDYREVHGQLKAWDPHRRWTTVIVPDSKMEEALCTRKLGEPISDILELYQNAKGPLTMTFPGEISQQIGSMTTVPFPTNYALQISKHLLKSIVDGIINCLFEWTIRLESEGILGNDMKFSQEEANIAKSLPQQINYYFGTVVNGSVSQSQVMSGSNNTASFNYENLSDLLELLKNSDDLEQLSEEDKDSVIELINEVEGKILEKKKPGIIRAALIGLRDFLIAGGANVAAALITSKLQGIM